MVTVVRKSSIPLLLIFLFDIKLHLKLKEFKVTFKVEGIFHQQCFQYSCKTALCRADNGGVFNISDSCISGNVLGGDQSWQHVITMTHKIYPLNNIIGGENTAD